MTTPLASGDQEFIELWRQAPPVKQRVIGLFMSLVAGERDTARMNGQDYVPTTESCRRILVIMRGIASSKPEDIAVIDCWLAILDEQEPQL